MPAASLRDRYDYPVPWRAVPAVVRVQGRLRGLGSSPCREGDASRAADKLLNRIVLDLLFVSRASLAVSGFVSITSRDGGAVPDGRAVLIFSVFPFAPFVAVLRTQMHSYKHHRRLAQARPFSMLFNFYRLWLRSLYILDILVF